MPKLESNAKVKKYNVYGEFTKCNISNLSSSDQRVAWWVIKQMCLKGWEPFSSAHLISGMISPTEGQIDLELKYYRG